MLFDLYGDYVELRGGEAWLGALVRLARELGVGEQAVRSAATRMEREGWLRSRREGRRSYYRLTERGRRLIAAGRERIFREPGEGWDGCWHLLLLSVPEPRRELRDRMRKELAWLGFGSVGNGVYLSPRDQRREVFELAARYHLAERMQLFRAESEWPDEPRALVGRAWNLEAADRWYATFLVRYQPEFERDERRHQRGDLDDAHAFAARFGLIHEFRRWPFLDPGLPRQLVPEGWHGLDAHDLFRRYHTLLTPAALRFYDGLIAENTAP
jgi:phenylacetic acid degradation operon negative regulatory protein